MDIGFTLMEGAVLSNWMVRIALIVIVLLKRLINVLAVCRIGAYTLTGGAAQMNWVSIVLIVMIGAVDVVFASLVFLLPVKESAAVTL